MRSDRGRDAPTPTEPDVAPATPAVYHLLGFPGTGKRTVGAELARQLSEHGEARLLDNHLVANPLFAVLPRKGGTLELTAEVVHHLGVMKRAFADAVEALCPTEWSLVFTNHVQDTAAGRAWVDRLRGLAAARQQPFVPVVLSCARKEALERVQAAERTALLKLTDPVRLQQLLDGDQLLRPPDALHLDVTRMTPGQAATAIIGHAAS